MRIVTFASGSTGNCSLISDGRVNILIDAGISMRRVTAALSEYGLTPQDLCGVLITHEHSDHISGLSMLNKYYRLPIIAPPELCAVLKSMKPELAGSLNAVNVGEALNIDGFKISSFRTPHDSSFSVGYRFEGSSVFAFATDTGMITDDMLYGLSGTDTALIEANHDIEMLRNGPYPYFLQKRILSERGHLSNAECGKLAVCLANSGTKRIILGHLSRENNTPALALETVKSALCGFDTEVLVAPMSDFLEVKLGEEEKCSV